MIKDQGMKGSSDVLRYLIFDALVCFNVLIIHNSLAERLIWIQRFVHANDFLLSMRPEIPEHAIEVKVKDFFRLTCTSFVSTS